MRHSFNHSTHLHVLSICKIVCTARCVDPQSMLLWKDRFRRNNHIIHDRSR